MTPTLKRENGVDWMPERERWKTVIACLYLLVITWLTAFVMVIVNDGVPDMKKYPPLPDVVLDHLPLIPWAFMMCELTGIILLTAGITVCLFHRHRCILMRRFCAISGTVYLLRCITMLVTSLSVPSKHLDCVPIPSGDIWDKLHNATVIWRGAGMTLQGVRTCGDYMFSGHAASLTLLCYFIREYTSERFYLLHAFTWLCNVFGAFCILAAHEHYSIDVFIAVYISSRLFKAFHTLADNGLGQVDLGDWFYFPLLYFFESKIEGKIPNEFEWPLTARDRPIVALGIITWVTLSTVFCNAMRSGPAGLANMIGFMALSCLTTCHFIAAMWNGPGYVPNGWKPEEEEEEDPAADGPKAVECLQYCDSCQAYKAPRSHHCRKCNRCVMKMDHHCPWINNCVGHYNHGHFVGFLFFAVLGCFHASILLGMSLYQGLDKSYYYYYGSESDPQAVLTPLALLTTLVGLGLSIGVVLAVGAQLYFQLRSIWKNQTRIEGWILKKAAYRLKDSEKTFDNPYHLGGWRNFFQVIRVGCTPGSDGIDWPLSEGAHKYDMALEQIYQKRDKRGRNCEYKIVRPYSGSWFPFWSMGAKVASRPPCTDEPRISLSVGDTVKVTWWKKHWLYGDKSSLSAMEGERVRGWFPRVCAVDPCLEDSHCPSRSRSKTVHARSRPRSKQQHKENGKKTD